MRDDMQEIFRLAAKYFYKEYKKAGGSQKELAKQLGITQPYLSSVINGSRSASLEMHCRIANILYGPYDKFLKAGRRLKNGLETLAEHEVEGEKDSVESLIAQLTHYVVHQKKVEKELEASREKYRDICLFTSDMIFELDADLKYTNVSGKVKETMGRSTEEILGRQPFDVTDEQEAARTQSTIAQSIDNRSVIDTIVCDTRNDKTHYRNVISKPLFSPETDDFIGMRGISKDITEKMELQNSLDEQMWLFQSAIDSITEMGVVITDIENRVLKWNATYRKLLGLPMEILETNDLLQYFSYFKENNLLADYDDFWKGIKETQKSTRENVLEFKLSDGRTIKRRSKPFFKDGKLAGRVYFVTDITNTSSGGQA